MNRKTAILIVVLVLIAGAIAFLESGKPRMATGEARSVAASASGDRSQIIADKMKKYDTAKELAGISGYINADQFKLSDLIGKKVILIDFWTYSCINCQRTLPYLKEWYAKYKDKGLVIVGVHTPEFDFEKDLANVQQAVKDAGIQYPVVLDNDMATWNAYSNQYWPREFLIDIDGYVVHDHIGEGGYDETEKAIQGALTERAKVLGDNADVNMPITVPNADDIQAASPETYFGSARNGYLGNGIAGISGDFNYSEPQTVNANTLYLIGAWHVTPEYAETASSVGSPQIGSDRIDYLFTAKGAYFVAGSAKPVTVEVTVDSAPVPKDIAGADIIYKNGRSYVTIRENRLYKLVDAKSADKHLLELVIPSGGLQAFTFTFG